MTRRYTSELDNLSTVYDAATKANVSALAGSVETWLSRPMLMVGSGGSYSTASFATLLHEQASGQLARSTTPLDIIRKGARSSGIVCFSASGRNRDIVAAFRHAVRQENSPLAALVLAEQSPLAELSERATHADVFSITHPSYSDGFLAVASLLASCVLLMRAYREAVDEAVSDLPTSLHALIERVTSLASLDVLADQLDPVMERPYTSVLYTPSLRPTAVDMESRFVEAALGALHIADLRNFGHGRHVWLAKRGEDTGVIALVGDGLSTLTAKTIDLLPDDVPVANIEFEGARDLQALAGMVVGLFVAQAAGETAGIDPGKPGVPAFGRALYGLAPQSDGKSQADLNREAAIRRKGQDASDPRWVDSYQAAVERINSARFGAVVLDYDGTLCDTKARFDPLAGDVAAELARLCSGGATLGIATGRGPSAGQELRRALPPGTHDRVIVGYYNGAEVRSLTDATDPLLPDLDSTHPVLAALAEDEVFASTRVGTRNVAQVSVGLSLKLSVDRAVSRAYFVLARLGIKGWVVASSHAIDILLKSQSKGKVVDAVAEMAGHKDAVLRIGDRGIWPGNDAALLDDPYGLSVDEASPHAEHGWALAPAGIKGVPATLYFLHRLKWSNKGGRMKLSLGARG